MKKHCLSYQSQGLSPQTEASIRSGRGRIASPEAKVEMLNVSFGIEVQLVQISANHCHCPIFLIGIFYCARRTKAETSVRFFKTQS